MKCLECKKEFIPRSVNQIYCCASCGVKYRKAHPDRIAFPSIQFVCSCCGKIVVTDGKRDKRTRFCCCECERNYWKHPPQEHSALNNYHASMLQWWENNVE